MESKPSLSGVEVRKTQEFSFPEVQLERPLGDPEHITREVGESTNTAPAAVIQDVAMSSLPEPVQPVSTPVDDSPLIAGDDDLIEKEWVEKAKGIIATTKDDPYRREREVGKLQADYLKKRYGRELGSVQ